MAFIPTVNCVKVAVNQRMFDQTIINTLWFSAVGDFDITPGAMHTLGAYLHVWWEEQLAPALSPDLELLSFTVTDQASAIAPSITTEGTVSNGGATGASMPSGDCLCVSFRTDERGRSARGRNYVSGVPRVAVVGNTVNETFRDDIQDAYGQLVNSGPPNWNWVIVSHTTGGVNRAFGLKQSVTGVIVVDRYLDHIDSRGTGRGT